MLSEQEVEQKREEYWQRGISVDIYEKISNPHPIKFCKAFKRIIPEPKNSIDLSFAEECVSNTPDVRFEKLDVSRRDQPPKTTIAYVLVAESIGTKIDELVRQIELAESEYKRARVEFHRKLQNSNVQKLITI